MYGFACKDCLLILNLLMCNEVVLFSANLSGHRYAQLSLSF